MAWPGSAMLLEGVNLAFPTGQLSLVTGHAGAGKSLLLASILEEAPLHVGKLCKPDAAVALVAQPPWIEDTSILENIVFGYPFDEKRYRAVVRACALQRDLEELPDQDMTGAGVNGAVLSGGQKWRVALARAVYSPAETLVLEDVLSAVDASVVQWLLDHVLNGELVRGRTRILATHNVDLCAGSASYMVRVKDGTAVGAVVQPTYTPGTEHAVDLPVGKKANSTPDHHSEPPLSSSRPYRRVFGEYMAAGGGTTACILGVVTTVIHRLASAGRSIWLTRWTRQPDAPIARNIVVYLAISLSHGILLAVDSVVFNSIGLGASRTLFQRLIRATLNSTLSYMDKTPVDKFLQSLGMDTYMLDELSASQLSTLLSSTAHILLIAFTG